MGTPAMNGVALLRVLVSGAVAMALSMGLVLALAQFLAPGEHTKAHHRIKAVLAQAAEATPTVTLGATPTSLMAPNQAAFCDELAKQGLRDEWLKNHCGRHSLLEATTRTTSKPVVPSTSSSEQGEVRSHDNEPRPRTFEVETGITHRGVDVPLQERAVEKTVYSKEAAETVLGAPVIADQRAVVTLPKKDGSIDEFPAAPLNSGSNILSSLHKTLKILPHLPTSAQVRAI